MSKINPYIFRAYDVRGIYPDDLNDKAAYKIVRAIAEFYPHIKKIVLATDPRLSSPALSAAVIKGFVDSGKEVLNLGVAPDSLFYFAILHYGYDGGVAISGSHNPKEYNGLTLNVRKKPGQEPEDIIEEDLERIKQRILNDKDFEEIKDKGSVRDLDVTDAYIDYVVPRIKLKKPLKVVIDVANGACGLLPEKVFKKLGCEVKTLFAEPDGTFPNHLPDPYKEENLKDLQKAVIKEKADIGFAFDTDGDRVAPVDNKGRSVAGEFCLLMLARQALKKKKGPIAHDMRVPKAFLDEMAKQGVKTYFSVSFHEAVRKRIIETGAVFGGELTYHFLFPLDYYLCDEAVFSSLKLAEIASSQESFADYVDSLPRGFISPEIFVPTPDEKKKGIIEKLQKYLRENDYDFIDVDGARINFANGWALARFANTSPFIKCRFEGDTGQDLKEVIEKAMAIFEKIGIPFIKENYQELGL